MTVDKRTAYNMVDGMYNIKYSTWFKYKDKCIGNIYLQYYNKFIKYKS